MDLSDWWWCHLLWNCPDMNVIGLHWRSVNISSGNGLVLSGKKPLPEPMLNQDFCCHMVSPRHIGLTTFCRKKGRVSMTMHFWNSKTTNIVQNMVVSIFLPKIVFLPVQNDKVLDYVLVLYLKAMLTHWPLGNLNEILYVNFSNRF